MKNKILCFISGCIFTAIALFTINWLIHRPYDAVKSLPEWQQEIMLEEMPWLSSARCLELGDYSILFPSNSFSSPQALITPHQKGFPQIAITNNNIGFVASNRTISVNYSPQTGEFISYDISTDGMMENTYYDTNFDSKFDLSIVDGQILIFHDSKWLPVQKDNGKAFIDIDGNIKRITIEGFEWKFIE